MFTAAISIHTCHHFLRHVHTHHRHHLPPESCLAWSIWLVPPPGLTTLTFPSAAAGESQVPEPVTPFLRMPPTMQLCLWSRFCNEYGRLRSVSTLLICGVWEETTHLGLRSFSWSLRQVICLSFWDNWVGINLRLDWSNACIYNCPFNGLYS